MSLEIVLALFEYLVMVLSISIHDAAEAWTANRLGDPTARMLGRISGNPLRHYDLWGTVVWPLLFLFRSPLVIGWGKDVPVTDRNLRHPSQANLIHLSGPIAQLLTATLCLIILVVLKHLSPAAAGSLTIVPLYALRSPVIPPATLPPLFPVILLLYLGILVNILLFAFNLMPLPTLDGGKILRYFLPYNAARLYDQYSFYITIGFLFLGFRLIYLIFSPLLSLYQSLLTSL
jgi:Zn-dependent protease